MTIAAPITITGATGAVGGRVARLLAGRAVPLRLVVRDPQRAPDLGAEVRQASYGDTGAMEAALAGCETLFLVSAAEAEDRVAQHLAAVDAAAAAGVQRVVYLSFLNAAAEATFTLARQHFATEEHIRASGMRHVFLRDSLYTDYVPLLIGEEGVIRGPAGTGRASWVTRDDIAAAAAAVLLTDGHDGTTFDVTGPEAVTLAETAARVAAVTGADVTYHAETLEEAYDSRAKYGAPPWMVDGWVSSYAAIAASEMETVSDAIALLTGRPAQSLEDYLSLHPEDVQRLRVGPSAG
jgi:uncharacterized protein YbjT (DUF2867 family)